MKPIKKPAMRLTLESIIRSFHNSHKKHLILTGNRGIGKSTLSKNLAEKLSPCPSALYAITTHAISKSHVELHDHNTGQISVIGKYIPPDASPYHPAQHEYSNQMTPVLSAFLEDGVNALNHAANSDAAWVLLDELGYLESCCMEFQGAVFELMEKKPVIAVLRKQSTAFLDSIASRSDIFLYDMDEPILPVGCVIMASGQGRRFGSNKLMADIGGKPMISHILDITGEKLFTQRIVVTRHKDIYALCKEQNIPVLLHDYPERNHTVRLGLSKLLQKTTLAACMFTACDQPCLTRESLETMVLTYSQMHSENQNFYYPDIFQLCFHAEHGNPVLFGQNYFKQLLQLPEGKGGSVLLKKYPHQIYGVEAGNARELQDIDTQKDLDHYIQKE